MQRLKSRDLERIYDERGVVMFRHGMTLLRDRAAVHDVIQDVFQRLAGGRGDAGVLENERAYLLKMVHHAAIDRIRKAKVRGEENWSGEQISPIRGKLAGIDVVDRTLRDLDKDNILMFAVVDRMRSGNRRNLLDVTKKLRAKPMPQWSNSFLSDVEHSLERLLPRGWFDANAAMLVQSQLDLRDDLGSADDMVRWRDVCDTHEKRIKSQSDSNGWMTIPKQSGVWPSLAKDSPFWQARIQLAIAACDLAIHRGVHGRFPGHLGELSVPDQRSLDRRSLALSPGRRGLRPILRRGRSQG